MHGFRIGGLTLLLLAASSAAMRVQAAETKNTSRDTASPAAEGEAPVTGEVIYVYDEAVKRAREELDITLRQMGYHTRRSGDGRTTYGHGDPWRPWVVVDDEGWMRIRRAPVQFGKPDLPGIWSGPLGYLVCLTQPTACVHVGGVVINRRKLAWQKEAVSRKLEPRVRAYREAVRDRAMTRRVEQELPEALDLLWQEGVPLAEGNDPLDTPRERRQALVDFWYSRAPTPWGQEVRRVVEDFVRYEVQAGPHPFSPAEIEAACRRAPGGTRPLVIPPADTR